LLRKLAVGGFLVATGRLSSQEFGTALRTALSARTEQELAPMPRPPKGRAA